MDIGFIGPGQMGLNGVPASKSATGPKGFPDPPDCQPKLSGGYRGTASMPRRKREAARHRRRHHMMASSALRRSVTSMQPG
jgi:hypothetical protein